MTQVSRGKNSVLSQKQYYQLGIVQSLVLEKHVLCLRWDCLSDFFFSHGRLINADACTLPSIIKHVTLIAQSHFALLSKSDFYIYLGKIM